MGAMPSTGKASLRWTSGMSTTQVSSSTSVFSGRPACVSFADRASRIKSTQLCQSSWVRILRVEKKLIVFGAGGHGKVVAAMAAEAGFLLAGFADDAAALHGATVFGLLVLG